MISSPWLRMLMASDIASSPFLLVDPKRVKADAKINTIFFMICFMTIYYYRQQQLQNSCMGWMIFLKKIKNSIFAQVVLQYGI